MKIGIFTDTYSPSVNETSIILEPLVGRLKKMGHKVTVVAPTNVMVVEDNEDVVRLNSNCDLGDNLVSERASKCSRADIKAVMEKDYDIIHVLGDYCAPTLGLKVAKEKNIPCIVTYTKDTVQSYVLSQEKLERKVRKFKVNHLNKRLAKYTKSANHSFSFFPSTAKEYVEDVVKYGLDISSISRISDEDVDAFVKEYKLKGKNAYMYVCDGRVDNNIQVIVGKFKDIIAKDKKTTLLVIGSCSEELDSIIPEEIKGNVVIVEGMDKLGLCYKVAKAYIHTGTINGSYVYCTIAMMLGVPVVAEYSEGIKDLIEDYKSGVLFHSIDEIEDLLKILSKDKDLVEKLKSNASKVKKEYDADLFANNLAHLYLKVIRRKNSERKDDKYKNRKTRRKYANK